MTLGPRPDLGNRSSKTKVRYTTIVNLLDRPFSVGDYRTFLFAGEVAPRNFLELLLRYIYIAAFTPMAAVSGFTTNATFAKVWFMVMKSHDHRPVHMKTSSATVTSKSSCDK